MSEKSTGQQETQNNRENNRVGRTRGLLNGNPAWKKGKSGNPKGRPPTKLISEALRRALEERGDADEICKVLIDIAKGKKKASAVQVAAAREIGDRTEGRAVQSHRIESAMDAETARTLVEIAKMMGYTGDEENQEEPRR